ncbi:MAG: hypothetical protein IPP82_10970 [Xanthomonadales bacterium]|nr:hypothetical protein [Xanthomonadales bacterium]
MRLRAEIADKRRVLEYQIRYVERMIAGGRIALRALDYEKDCEQECEALIADCFQSSQVWGLQGAPFPKRQLQA